MRRWIATWLVIFALGGVGIALPGCEDEGPIEETGEQIEDTGDELE